MARLNTIRRKQTAESGMIGAGRPLLHLADRIFGPPLMIHQNKLRVVLEEIGGRLDPVSYQSALEALPFVEGNIAPLSALSLREPSNQKSYAVTDSGIAIIPIEGMLMKKSTWMSSWSGMCTYEDIGEQFAEALADSTVRAVLFDVDSPGGETHGCFELADQIYQARGQGKPIYGSANDLAASAAYALLSSCERAFVTRTGAVGSVGVYSMHVSQQEMDKKMGLKYTYISAGERKVDGNPHTDLSETAQAEAQAEVDRQYSMFTATVARNRGVAESKIVGTKALCFFAENAIPLLADEVGTLEDAVAALEDRLEGIAVGSSAARPRSSASAAAVAAATTDLQANAGMPVTTQPEQENIMSKPNATALSAEDQAKLAAAEAEVKRIKALQSAPANQAAASAAAPEPNDTEPDTDEDDQEACDPNAPQAQTYTATSVVLNGGTTTMLQQPAQPAQPAQPVAARKGRSIALQIAELCTMTGNESRCAELVAKAEKGETTLSAIRAEFLEQRSKASHANLTSASHSGTGATGSALDRMEQMAQTIVQNSGGKIRKSAAYEQVLLANPEIYEAYEDEQAQAIQGGRKAKREYVARMAPRFKSMGLGSMPSGVVDNLPL